MNQPYRKPRTPAYIYAAYGLVFLALMAAIAQLQHKSEATRPVIVLADPPSLQKTVEPQTAQTQAVQTTTAPPNEPPKTTPTPTAKPVPNTPVVWEMSQRDPTKPTAGQPIGGQPANVQNSNIQNLATTEPTSVDDTPTAPVLNGNQAVLHPDDVPAIEHRHLSHLANSSTEKNTAKTTATSPEEQTPAPKNTEPQNPVPKDPTPQNKATPDTEVAPEPTDSDVLEGVRELLRE